MVNQVITSYLQMFSDELIDQLSQFIIRPHREIYGLDKLGPKKIFHKSHALGSYIEATRQQATIFSEGKKIQISVFQPLFKPGDTINSESQGLSKSWKKPSEYSYQETYCEVTIFLHANSGSRLEGLQYCKYLLQYGQTVVLFDYSGSGVSEGQYVSMGLNQAKDLGNVIHYIQDKYSTSLVNLWGRSMGAVTAVLYASRYPRSINRMVLDSPFCSFRQLVKEIVNSRTGLPQFLFGAILSKIQQNIKQKLSLNLMEIDLKNNITKLGMDKIPIFFLISKDDKLVLPTHVETLYELHKGEKKIHYLQGSHNKPRPSEIRQQSAEFLCNRANFNNSSKFGDGFKRQYLSIISRPQDKKKPIFTSLIMDNPSTPVKLLDGEDKNSNNSSSSPSMGKSSLFLNLSKKYKNQQSQTAQITPRDQHSTNKVSGMKISLSQLKKSQTQIHVEPIRNSGIGYVQQAGQNFYTTSVFSSHSQTLQCSAQSLSQKVNIDFKKHMRPMAIQYKNKMKQHINKT